MLKRNKIIVNNNSINIEGLKGLIKQNPNKKFLWLKLKLAFYNLANSKSEKWPSSWLKNIGEPPVVLDTNYTNSTLKQINIYMDNHGYFNSKAEKSIKFKKNKKAIVTYKIIASQPYTLRNINYIIDDDTLKNLIISHQSNTFIKSKDIYDIDNLEKERDRITSFLKNTGYFSFAKDYIIYKVDSNLNNKCLDLTMIVRNPFFKPSNNPDTLIQGRHKRYIIKKVCIYPDFNILGSDTINKDTLLFHINQGWGDKSLSEYYFIYNHTLKIKPKTLTQSIFINNNNYFNLLDVEQTYNRLAELRNYRFINISFKELPIDSNETVSDQSPLLCNIELSKSKVNSMTYEFEGRNSSDNYGIAGNIIFQNKNLFDGAEIFHIKLDGALEIQKVFLNNNTLNFPLFNTYEYGATMGLEIPKFLIPIGQEFFPKYFKPKTTLSFGYNYQNRPDFQRTITNITFGYNWKQSKYIQHIYNPIEINSVKIYTDSAFQSQINALTDKRLQNQYTNHFILDMKYSFIYSNQDPNKKKDFTYFRANLELAGNSLNLMKALFDNQKDTNGYYEVFKLVYSQYVRYDMDFRHYFYLNSKNTFVVRSAMGLGLPYGNSAVLPYEKSFFAGGTNDIRAWPLRGLGPGAYSTTNTTDLFDQIGDILLELNVEERFPIYKYLQGAVFVDAGNIWLYKSNSQFPDGEFKLNTFADQIAVGTGVGLRVDLSYFIIRVDAAVPVKDPSKPVGERWVINHEHLKNFVLNFGIGFPF